MKTIDETRRIKLEMLIQRYGGKIADLNEALGYERTHSQLARIRNRNARTDRPGKFFDMGDEQAREIEGKLSLGLGWMDTPPTYAELHGEDDPRAALFKITEDLSAAEWYTALTVLTALKTARAGQPGHETAAATAPTVAPEKKKTPAQMMADGEAELAAAIKSRKAIEAAVKKANDRRRAKAQNKKAKTPAKKALSRHAARSTGPTFFGPLGDLGGPRPAQATPKPLIRPAQNTVPRPDQHVGPKH